MSKIIKDLFTERDNQTWDIVRILCTIGFFYYLALATYELIKHCSDFSLQDMAIGITIILGTSSAGISLKSKVEK